MTLPKGETTVPGKSAGALAAAEPFKLTNEIRTKIAARRQVALNTKEF